jgi:hypothetical protein
MKTGILLLITAIFGMIIGIVMGVNPSFLVVREKIRANDSLTTECWHKDAIIKYQAHQLRTAADRLDSVEHYLIYRDSCWSHTMPKIINVSSYQKHKRL